MITEIVKLYNLILHEGIGWAGIYKFQQNGHDLLLSIYNLHEFWFQRRSAD